LIETPDLAGRLGEAARQRMVEQFSMDKTVRQIERLYSELVGARSKAAHAA
jgi:glycosyltransferase involved in cell wall biosynthesis